MAMIKTSVLVRCDPSLACFWIESLVILLKYVDGYVGGAYDDVCAEQQKLLQQGEPKN